MAELFDEQRQESVTSRQPPFNAAVQLPLVGELDRPDRLNFLMVLLGDLLLPFAHLSNEPVKAALDEQVRYKDELRALHLRVLDELADEQEQLNAYQLGLALSDMCWLASKANGPDVFIETFTREQVAGLRDLLNGAGAAIPPDSAAIVGKSLENWQDWIDVNAVKMKLNSAAIWAQAANPVLRALRIQGVVWHSVLTADPEVSVQPALGAWTHAAAAVARAARIVAATILRRFWPIAVIFVAALALLLYLVISNLSGASQAWTSLATVVAFAGGGGFTLGTGVTRAFGGISAEAWSAAKLDAQAWNITWLPATPQTMTQRARLDSRGVSTPWLRKNLDA
jgi:hypothetical protein